MTNPIIVCFVFVCVFRTISMSERLGERNTCPFVCSCLGVYVDCSKQNLHAVPKDLPSWTENLDLRENSMKSILKESLQELKELHHLKLNKNFLSDVPFLSGMVNLTYLSLSHNEIHTLNAKSFENMTNLKTLNLHNNHLVEIKLDSFPADSSIQILNLNSNQIVNFQKGSLDNLSLLIELKLNRNQLFELHKELFRHLKHLKILELNKNKFTEIESLSFYGLEGLRILKLQRNSIHNLLDGAFWELRNLSILQLDFNNITTVTKGWLYGLISLNQLTLSHNRITDIEEDGWEFCQQLIELNLSNNKLSAIKKETFHHLSKLQKLHLENNFIEYIAEGAFNSTPLLEVLELNCNRISWTIEDMNGVFIGLSRLIKFGLASNHIKTLNKRAFIGLEKIRKLDLSNNNITSMQDNTFAPMSHLSELVINTTSLLCDCSLKWLPVWLKDTSFENVITVCSYPEWLKGRPVIQVPLTNFTCDDFPKPRITENPNGTDKALKGGNVTLLCKAASSSTTQMTFQWKKDNIDLKYGHVRQFIRSYDGKGTEQSSELTLVNITQNDAGKYQCVVSNSFGTTYSKRTKISVLIFPSFVKTPVNITTESGNNARLECAASGLPHPRIAWQKDGGIDFPAARERRMHVMPTDDVFFITKVKPSDMGVYSCTAQNPAGSIVVNVTLTVLESPSFVKQMESKEIAAGEPIVLECMASGSPKPKLVWKKDGGKLVTTERHFFTADDQLLIIVDTKLLDAGKYECEMSNSLGTVRGYSQLSIIPAVGPVVNESDMTGIIIITVVCCAVGTSVIWVVIIYQTRKRMGLVDVGNESCQYPSTLLPSELGSAPHLYLDSNSEHSSSKDSGTGDSAKRSSDDLLIGNGLTVNIEGNNTQNMEPTNQLLSKDVNNVVGAVTTPVLRSLHPRRTDHDRLCKTSLFCGSCSQRWSVPHCVELPPACSYHSLPLNLRTGQVEGTVSDAN